MSGTDTGVLAIIAGIVAIIAMTILLVVVYLYRERRILRRLQEHEDLMLAAQASGGMSKSKLGVRHVGG